MGFKLDEKSGLWEAYFSKRHPLTRQPVTLRRRGLKSQAEARRVERELIGAVEMRLVEEKSPLWREAVVAYLSFAKELGYTNHTIHDYETGLYAYTMERWGSRRVNSITTAQVRDLLNNDLAHLAASTRKNALKFIRAVFSYAQEQHWIERDPVPKMKFKIRDRIKGVLTEQQIRQLLQQAKDMGVEWYPVWVIALYTGLRSGELIALTWDKVNLENRQIKVDCSWSSKDGLKSTKSGHDRIVEIAPPLLETLKELKLKTGGQGYVLPRILNWERGSQARELKMFLLGLGLPPVRFHDLRASWATLLLSKGVEPIKVMKMGGWANLKTMQIYMRKAGVDVTGATDCLNLHKPGVEYGQLLKLEM